MSDETGISSADTSTEAVVDENESDPPTVKETPPSRSVTPSLQQPTTVAVTAPSDDGSNTSEVEVATITTADDELTPRRGVSHIRPRPHTFRPVVLRPPPRRVTQKKSYESIESLASFKREAKAASNLSPRSNREIILTPVESIDSMRSEEGKLRKESHRQSMDRQSMDRPASVISTTTVAFGV